MATRAADPSNEILVNDGDWCQTHMQMSVENPSLRCLIQSEQVDDTPTATRVCVCVCVYANIVLYANVDPDDCRKSIPNFPGWNNRPHGSVSPGSGGSDLILGRRAQSAGRRRNGPRFVRSFVCVWLFPICFMASHCG